MWKEILRYYEWVEIKYPTTTVLPLPLMINNLKLNSLNYLNYVNTIEYRCITSYESVIYYSTATKYSESALNIFWLYFSCLYIIKSNKVKSKDSRYNNPGNCIWFIPYSAGKLVSLKWLVYNLQQSKENCSTCRYPVDASTIIITIFSGTTIAISTTNW